MSKFKPLFRELLEEGEGWLVDARKAEQKEQLDDAIILYAEAIGLGLGLVKAGTWLHDNVAMQRKLADQLYKRANRLVRTARKELQDLMESVEKESPDGANGHATQAEESDDETAKESPRAEEQATDG